MKRRDFLTAAGGASLAALATMTTANAQTSANAHGQEASDIHLSHIRTTYAIGLAAPAREYVEFRKYTVANAAKRAQLVEILDRALIPGLNRQGIRPVGVFVPIANVTGPTASAAEQERYALNVFVAIPHKTADSFANANIRLVADAQFMRDAAPIFEATSQDPVYTRCDTSLLYNFPTMPVMEVPDLGPDRVFQWRLYRSFNIERNVAKIHMFDQGGELPLFREVGLTPIFFGDTVAGAKLPAFEYMLGFPSAEARVEAWRTFIPHPKWVAMRNLPEYADTATEIDNVILTPSPGSQI